MKEIYFAGGCFWGTQRLFQKIDGVVDSQCGYANGREEILPDYRRVCDGDTGYRETVRVIYDEEKVTLNQLMTAFFHVIDPTVEKQQGPDVGDQYQTGIYYRTEEDKEMVLHFVENEKIKYEKFAVEVEPLTVFVEAEEYHQDYLIKNPTGYCHIPLYAFFEINKIAHDAKK